MDYKALNPVPCGRHLLIDVFGANYLHDSQKCEVICREAAIATGATIISSHFHEFGKDHGITGVVILAESHISIHTWPERSLATIDIYVCGSCDPWLAVSVISDGLEASEIMTHEHQRGLYVLETS